MAYWENRHGLEVIVANAAESDLFVVGDIYIDGSSFHSLRLHDDVKHECIMT